MALKKETNITPTDAINEFYKMKDKYESGYYEKYVNPIVKSNQSKREKRVAYSKLPKHECINCKRNVGTIFTIKNDIKEDVKKYVEENDITTAADVVVKSAGNKSKVKIFIIQQIDRKIELDEIAESKGLSFEELLNEMEQKYF